MRPNQGKTICYRLLDGILWMRDGREIQPRPVAHATITAHLTRAQVRSVVSLEVAAIDRCVAAMRLPTVLLGDVLSSRYVDNLRRVARQLHPVLVVRARETQAPMALLLRACRGATLEEQCRLWDSVVAADSAA